MSDIWRIFLVEGDEALNRNIVNSLRKDGYIVQGVTNGSDAVRVLWAEEYDVVLCDLKAPGADGFELLQWLRASRPNTRMILIGGSDSSALRMQALESGAAGYLEKPLDLHLLKEELRRLLQQTGFSANLDSFDLLDVIQIITMSRKSIALLVNTGLEERGLLCFKGGELVWAEYGILRGEEAFFALAAHKNGTVTHQSWNEQVTPNVTQPLSRLIFQALQYRTKYADQQPFSGEQKPIVSKPQYSGALQPLTSNGNGALTLGDEDDTPFGVLADPIPPDGQDDTFKILQNPTPPKGETNREWWEKTGALSRLDKEKAKSSPAEPLPTTIDAAPTVAIDGLVSDNGTITPSTVYKTAANQRADLPSWLTDQPTASDMPAIRSSSLTDSTRIPATPRVKPSSPEWIPSHSSNGSNLAGQNTGMRKQATGPQKKQPTEVQKPVTTDTGVRRTASPEWQPPEQVNPALPPPVSDAQKFAPVGTSGVLDLSDREYSPSSTTGSSRTIKHRYNYSALVSALQTLGYSIAGFVAAAIVSIDGQPIAQVAVDDLNISRICKFFGGALKNVLQSLDQGMWGDYEDMVITSSDRYILIRVIGGERNVFQLLITTREAEPVESLEVMVNVEGAISAALHS